VSESERPTCDQFGDAPRILITRLSAVGDSVQTMPLVTALRRRLPRAKIIWAVERGAAPLVSAHPAVDDIVIVPRKLLAKPHSAWQVRRALGALAIDLAIDPQSLSKSASVAWLSGARRRIGFESPSGREISPWLNNDLVATRSVHMVDKYLELLRPLGIERPEIEFGFRVPSAARQSMQAVVCRPEFADGFAVLNPGAGWDSKRWPWQRHAEVARHLGQTQGMPSLVVWAGEREHAWARSIAEQSEGNAFLAPKTSLLELAALLQQARLMVASDTGPLHLAAALGTPCVGMFGSTRREVCGPYGERNIALQVAFDGSPVRKRPGADNWAVRRVTTDMVCHACDTLLGRQAPRSLASVTGSV
jgi:lipopolysaccharide heptosyltransferase I